MMGFLLLFLGAYYAQRNEDRMARFRIRRRHNFTRTLSDAEFSRRFRLNKHGFRLVCNDLRKHSMLKGTRLYPLEIKVLLTLNFLATGSNQKILGLSHKIPQRTVSRFVTEVVKALSSNEMLMKWVPFPATTQDRTRIKTEFQSKYCLPGVIGCIDCTHINIVRPSRNGHSYLKSNGTHSINVQMICDSDLRIINVNPKFGGATHNSVIWMNSNVNPYLRELHQNGEDSYLLGDSDYPRQAWLMTPIPHAHRGSREYEYTMRHGQAHNSIKRCFGALKTRWRCLLKAKTLHYTPVIAARIVLACSVLHNVSQHLRLPLPPIDPSALEEENYSPAEFVPEVSEDDKAQGLEALDNILRICS